MKELNENNKRLLNDVEKSDPIPDFYIYTDDNTLIHIMEGDGCNLWDEDKWNGYVDYAMIDYMDCTPEEALHVISDEDWDKVTDGMQSLMRTFYQDFKSIDEAAHYFLNAWFGKDDSYDAFICIPEGSETTLEELRGVSLPMTREAVLDCFRSALKDAISCIPDDYEAEIDFEEGWPDRPAGWYLYKYDEDRGEATPMEGFDEPLISAEDTAKYQIDMYEPDILKGIDVYISGDDPLTIEEER